MASIFSKIIAGDIPGEKILESDRLFAFLDIRPINPGHVLVVPKQETAYLFDLDEELLSEMLPFSKKISQAIEKATQCERVGVMVAGFEIPHAHLHLIPINGEGELSFDRAKPAKPEELKVMGEKIRSHLN